MAKTTTDKNVRKLTKLGKQSIAVTIPIDIVRELKWFTLLNDFKSDRV